MKKTSLSWQSVTNEKRYAYHWPVDQPKAIICLVHGMGEHCERYHHMAAFYNKNGIAVLAYDQQGHGQSAGKRGHMPKFEVLLDDVGLLLQKAKEFYPDTPQILYGHSMGGNVCLNYVLRRKPELAACISTGPWVRLAFEPPGFLILLGKVMRYIYPGFSQSSDLDVNQLSHDAAVVKAYVDDPLVHDKVTAATGLGFMEAGEWLLQQDAGVDFPTLIMHGQEDKITSPDASKEFAEKLKGDVTYKQWKGLYHEIHNEPSQQEIFDYSINWIEGKVLG